MFRITTITRGGLIAVACVAVAAPQALAKTAAKGGKAKVTKTQTVKKVASNSDSITLRSDLTAAFSQGCQNGTVPDRTMGGDNNNYEYYGDPCTVSAPISPSLVVLAASGQQTATPTAVGTAADDNTNYEYYGSTSGS